MSKSQTLGWAVVCGVIAVCCHAIGLGMFDLAAAIGALGFLLLYGYKKWRDAILIAEAKSEAQQEPAMLIPEMSSPGSSRLFVPQPLERP